MDRGGIDLDERDHAAAVSPAYLDHAIEQRISLVDDVVAQEDGEWLVPDVLLGTEHGVAGSARLGLPNVMDRGKLYRLPDRPQPLLVPLGLQRRLELRCAIEVILERAFGAARHEEDVGEASGDRLLDYVLDRRLVDDGGEVLLGRPPPRQGPGTTHGPGPGS